MPKISALPVAATVGGSDVAPIVQASTTKQAAMSVVLTYIQGAIQITEAQVTNLTTDLAAKLAKASNLSDLTNAATARQNLGIGPLTNGQLIIGATGLAPVLAVLTGSSGITITNTSGGIDISGGGSGYGWTEVTGTSQAMAVDSGYIANNAGLVTLTLPAVAVVGDSVIIQGKGTGLFSIAQNAGQTIHFGSSNTTTGVGGSLTATNRYDSIELLCITANTDWAVLTGVQGTFTVV